MGLSLPFLGEGSRSVRASVPAVRTLAREAVGVEGRRRCRLRGSLACSGSRRWDWRMWRALARERPAGWGPDAAV